MYQKSCLLFFALLFIFGNLNAQITIDPNEDSPVLLINTGVGFFFPGGDLADRFDNFLEAGIGGEYVTKTNWTVSADFNYQFGNRVKEDVVSNLRDPEGVIFGSNFEFALLELRMRGMNGVVQVGKVLPVFGKDRRSGLFIGVGGGWQEHWVRLQQDPESFIPQINGDYANGYDRYSAGLLLRQSLGIRVLSDDRLINFKLTFETGQAFTKGIRDWNYNTNQPDTNDRRTDLYFGVRLMWSLPIFFDKSDDIRYY